MSLLNWRGPSAKAEGSALRGPGLGTGEQILRHALVMLELSVNRLVFLCFDAFSAEAERSALWGLGTGEQILKYALVILELSVNRLVPSY